MKRLSTGGMFHLLPAGHARRDDDGVRLLFHGWKQATLANRHRNIVVLLFEAERTSHSATSGIDFFHVIGQRDGFFQETGSDERLLVAVTMDQSLILLFAEIQPPPTFLFFADDKFFQQERSIRHGLD